MLAEIKSEIAEIKEIISLCIVTTILAIIISAVVVMDMAEVGYKSNRDVIRRHVGVTAEFMNVRYSHLEGLYDRILVLEKKMAEKAAEEKK